MNLPRAFSVTVILLLVRAAGATNDSQPVPLAAGAVAPALQVSEWIKGGPIPRFGDGKVYLLEFWATWCGPCIRNIPHLNALQKKYGRDGLVVIGFTGPDRTPDRPDKAEGNSLKHVREFLASTEMNYPIAYDTPRRSTFAGFFGAPVADLPHSFVIGRDGKVIASGHPYYLDDVIASVMDGTWDPATGPQRQQRVRDLLRAVDDAEKKSYAEFKAARAELARESPLYHDRTLYAELLRAIVEGDAPAVRAVGARMARNAIEKDETADLGFAINRMVREQTTKVKAAAYLDVADAMSEAFVVATGGRDYGALTLRADWHVCRGDLAWAVTFQRRAVAVAPEARKPGLKARLSELESQLAVAGTASK